MNSQRISDLKTAIGLSKIYSLENYFTKDLTGAATEQTFSWNSSGLNFEYNPSGLGLPGSGHSAPIVFYANTVKYTTAPYPASLNGIDPTTVGWQKSLFFNEIAFSEQPESRDLISGQTAIFSATAFQRGRPSRPQADFTYQWEHYMNGSWQNLGGNQSLILVPTTASMSGRNYRVTASIGSESTVSRVVTLNLRDSTVASAPAAPTNLSALTASSSRINLTWTDKSSNESNFKIRRRLGGSSSWMEIATLPAGTQTYSSTGLAASTNYDFQVYAINSAGPSGMSNTASARTSAATTTSYTLAVNAVDLTALQTLSVSMYSWEGASTDFRSNTTSLTRSAAAGKQITVSAPATLAGGRIFQYWLKDGSSREYKTAVTLTMDGQHAVDAIYGTNPPAGRTLQSISIIGPSSVDERTAASYSARATYTDGTTGTVSASWDESSSYASISSNGLLDAAAVSSDKSVTIDASATISEVTKTASKTITIRNVATAQTYTLTRNVVGGGRIGYSPQATQYAAGTVVSLHGNEDGGWLFSHWSGDASGSDDDTTVRMDGNRSVTAHFVADTSEGGLQVNLLPPQAEAETAQWKYRNYTAWRDSGNTQVNIPVGTGYVKFKDIPGWITPDNVQATILGGQTITVNATYREIKGAVQVTLTPPQAAEAGARWRLNGGAWQESGTTLADAPTGSNTVEFLSVPGWGTPPSQSINVARGVTTVRTGDYTPPPGLPIITSVAPRTGPIADGTTVTLEGANFLPGATVTFGGVSATSVTVVSPTRITAVTPPRASYGTVALALSSGGQTVTQANGFSYLNPLGSNVELVGQIGGNVEAVAVVGNLCYYGEGTSLVVMDLTNSAVPVERGRIALPNIIKDLAISGNTAYAACASGGLYAVNISSPTAPSINGFFQTEGGAYGVKIDGNRAYIGTGSSGFAILDVVNPAAMFQLGSLDTAGTVFRLDVGMVGSDRYAFLAEYNLALRIVRVTDPANPVEVATITALGGSPGFRDVKVGGTKLYSIDSARVKIWDISISTVPTEIGVFQGVGASFFDVVGTRLFTCSGNLTVGDLTTTPNPTYLGDFILSGSCSRLIVSNGLAYAAMGNKGLKVVNVSNPSSMSLKSSVHSGITAVEDVRVVGGVAYVGTGDGLHTLDVSNAARPVRMAHLTGNRVTSLAIADGKATLVNYGENYVRIANVANPSVPSLLGTYTGLEAWDVASFGNTPVLAGATTGSPRLPKIDVLNLAQPSSPQSGGSLVLNSTAGGASDSATVVGLWAFVGRQSTQTLYVVNLSNPSSPQNVGSVVIPSSQSKIAASEDGNFVYVPVSSGVQVVDVTVKSAPVLGQIANLPLSRMALL